MAPLQGASPGKAEALLLKLLLLCAQGSCACLAIQILWSEERDRLHLVTMLLCRRRWYNVLKLLKVDTVKLHNVKIQVIVYVKADQSTDKSRLLGEKRLLSYCNRLTYYVGNVITAGLSNCNCQQKLDMEKNAPKCFLPLYFTHLGLW